MVNERLITSDELAARWGLHKATVLRLYHSGVLLGVELCRGKTRTTVRFRLAAVEAFERKREQQRNDGEGRGGKNAGPHAQ